VKITSFLWIIAVSVGGPKLKAQPATDSTFVRYYPDCFNLRTFITTRDLSWTIHHQRTDLPRITYAPNADNFIGLGAYVFDIGVAAAIRLPSSFQRDPSRFGDTKAIDAQTNIYGKQWNVDLAYQDYQGYYVRNTARILPEFTPGDELLLRPDLRATNFLVNAIYVNTPAQFSFRSGFKYGEKQIKRKGSWLGAITFSHFILTGERSIIPDTLRDEYGATGTLRWGRLTTLGFLPGYGHNASWRNFFANARLFAGAGLQRQHYALATEERHQFSLRTQLNFRMAVGYDNDRWFIGSKYVLQRTYTSLEELRINSAVNNLRFFTGYRFQKVGLLKKYSIKNL
jgi:hypothetical protein